MLVRKIKIKRQKRFSKREKSREVKELRAEEETNDTNIKKKDQIMAEKVRDR